MMCVWEIIEKAFSNSPVGIDKHAKTKDCQKKVKFRWKTLFNKLLVDSLFVGPEVEIMCETE